MTPKPKQVKRDEAEQRNAAWAALDWLTQLDRLLRRPGSSTRQRDRIREPLTQRKKAILAERRAESDGVA